MKYREDLGLDQLDQLAREFWQDDLAKFFLKQKEPTYTEYRMFQAGYQKALEFQEIDKVKKLEIENSRLREALEILAAENSGTCCECPDVKDIARAALEDK